MDLENYTNINIFKKVFEKREVSSSTNMIEQPHHFISKPTQHAGGFNPYVNNQGTTLGKNSPLLTNISLQLSQARTLYSLQQIPESLRASTFSPESTQRLPS